MPGTSKLDRYLDDLCSALGHKARHDPFRGYCRGLMLPIERKSVEPLAAHLAPQNVRSAHQSLHHFVADSPWSDAAVLERVRTRVEEAMGEAARFWLVDDTGIPKKGNHSVGVSHQYCGQLGKQANCQVAVSLSLATDEASVPIDYRLYLPKGWAADSDRCAAVGVPEDLTFATKPEIALAQLTAAVERGVTPGVVLADAGYGHESAFRDGLTALGLAYVVGIREDTTVWAPWTEPKAERHKRGERVPPSRRRFAAGHAPQSVRALAEEIDAPAWRRVTWREGTNETLHSRFAAIRVSVAHRDRPGRAAEREEQWLLIEWPKGEAEPTKYWLSTLPQGTSTRELVRTAKRRWRVERDYQELKQELGLNHYEGRSWRGFHHHASLCIAAYGFLVIERLRYPEKKKRRQRPAPALPESYVPRGSAETNAAPR